jgi:hypothetical protein
MLRGMADRHKAQFAALVREAGQQIAIRHPATRQVSEAPANKVLGKRTTPLDPTDVGAVYYVDAIVSTGYRQVDYDFGAVPAAIAAIGKRDPSMVVARCLLEDVQPVGASPFSDTYFHGAKAVIIGTDSFEVVGVDRSGLPPAGPYIVWVGLKRIGVAT